jgi:energy-coupling factor transporter ATP-binding protein EcfA2
LKAGEGHLGIGLKARFGLDTDFNEERYFFESFDLDPTEKDFEKKLVKRFTNFYDFLKSYILLQQKIKNDYIHITAKDNIIVSPLYKGSGVAVILETHNATGQLLPPNQWTITRTKNKTALDRALIFRSQDIQDFYSDAEGIRHYITDRYKLYVYPEKISIDSLLDNTENHLVLDSVNSCFQILASDKNIIIVLSNSKEVTIVNTHRSVIPHKWPKKIVLPEEADWMRVDENMNMLFYQTVLGEVVALDITGDHPIEIERLGTYEIGFEIDQLGNLLLLEINGNHPLVKITTNVNALEIPEERKSISSVLENLSHLFKGESIFTQMQFAKVIEPSEDESDNEMPASYEAAKVDFETNVEHMLAESGTDYNALLEVQNKVAIARQNIGEELTTAAEKGGIILIGAKLQRILNSIIGPSEKRVRDLIENARASIIIKQCQSYVENLEELSDPNAYREILNNLRAFQEELDAMLIENSSTVMTEFKEFQVALNTAFSQQVSNDGSALQDFILGEIEQIEKAIDNTFDGRRLESLLSTHPAALELMSLLKQPYILQSVAKERKFSPAGIQSRLFEKIDDRQKELAQEKERQEAERTAAKQQLANMIKESIDFFIKKHSGGFSDIELASNAPYQGILKDISKLEKLFSDVRLSMELRRRLEKRILDRNREDLEKLVAFEGKYAFIKNDPDLFIDLESTIQTFPEWTIQMLEKRNEDDMYMVSFVRSTDYEVYRPSAIDNLESNNAFEIHQKQYQSFAKAYGRYADEEYNHEFLNALWHISQKNADFKDYPQFNEDSLTALAPANDIENKALRCALQKRELEKEEKDRLRNVPQIGNDFVDETPYFQAKLQEFVIKAKLQLVSGSGIILLTGPPATGKSVFLKFMAAVMNREYFEHAADKWQTKNSLITSIKFGDYGPYSTPAGFTKAITTPYSLISIEEIKEWPEALRKSLNPFFAGSDIFTAPDGTRYHIGENILLCAAANLGSMYRQDDEPFTADFWSRIEVVEYNYAPQMVDGDYIDALSKKVINSQTTMRDLIQNYFKSRQAPKDTVQKAIYYSKQFLEFIILPKTDDQIKRQNLSNYINFYFESPGNPDMLNTFYSPEEAAKVGLRRLKVLQGYSTKEFFELYNHFINDKSLRTRKLSMLQNRNVDKYENLKIVMLCLRYMEGCLRNLREQFYATAGQTEIEGTNREFIKAVHLLDLMGKI